MVQSQREMLLKQIKPALTQHYGERLSKVILFGSEARGEAQPGSDIDILVILKTLANPLTESEGFLGTIIDWNLRYAELVSCCFMDEDRFTRENSPFLLNIRREGVLL